MKNLTAFLLFVCAVANAQFPANGSVSALSSDGTPTALEVQQAQIVAHTKGFVAYSSKTYYEVRGNRSPVRFHAGVPLLFALPPSEGNPSALYVLRKLTPSKKAREVQILSLTANPFGARMSSDTDSSKIQLQFSRSSDSSFLATTPPLEPGEYELNAIGSASFYCFGVD